MKLDLYDSLTSTQDVARLHLQEGDTGPAWIMAKRQTHGLGRMGRSWNDGEGNLMATHYQTMAISLHQISQLAFVVALAVHDALVLSGVGLNDLRIKWPNDIVINGHKLCGILISSESQGKDEIGIAIGIGVNIGCAPDIAAYETTCLQQILTSPPDPETLLRHIDRALDQRITHWLTDGFDTIQQEWLSKAYGHDAPITVTAHDQTVTGQVIGLSSIGALILKDALGAEHVITSSD